MDMGSLRAEYAAAVLHEFVTTAGQRRTAPKYTPEDRAARSAKLRAEMHAIIDNGQRPEGYRANWVRSAVGHVIELLSEIAEQFNAEHQDDVATTGDVLDILATAKGHLIE
jgi:hypothetical protein